MWAGDSSSHLSLGFVIGGVGPVGNPVSAQVRRKMRVSTDGGWPRLGGGWRLENSVSCPTGRRGVHTVRTRAHTRTLVVPAASTSLSTGCAEGPHAGSGRVRCTDSYRSSANYPQGCPQTVHETMSRSFRTHGVMNGDHMCSSAAKSHVSGRCATPFGREGPHSASRLRRQRPAA